MNLEITLAQSVAEAIKKLYGAEFGTEKIQLQKTRKEFEGDFTLVVFPFLALSKKRPEETAQEIGEYLKANLPIISSFNVVKGFLNLAIAPSYWVELLKHIDATDKWGTTPATEESPLVMVEYSSPNTNKPLHLGHIRNNLLGYALSNIIAANGNKVVKTNIVNDRGIHICKSMLAWQKYGEGETPESSGKKGDHLIGDYYVAFDKHYKAEVAEIMEREGCTKEEAEAYQTAVVLHCGREYARLGWAMQLHFSCMRNPNSRKLAALGPDTGFDSMASTDSCAATYRLMDAWERDDQLPKTILYCLNGASNGVIGTMLGNFQQSGIKGKIQMGSGWWFMDQKDGMEDQMKALASVGLLSTFVGMLTDSRSFVSYPRHEYFRRILCNLLGTWVENGEYPNDEAALRYIVQGICFYNAKRYFSLED